MEHRLRRSRPGLGLAILFLAAAPAVSTAQEPPPAAEDQPAVRADLSEVNDLVRAGAYAEAESRLEAMQQDYPDDPALLLMRGELLLSLKRPDDALPLLRRSAELDPTRPRVAFQLATALQLTGDHRGALDAYAREIEINEDVRVKVLSRLNRSLILEQLSDWDASAKELEAVLELEPTRLEVYGDLAGLYIKAGRLDEAEECLHRGLEAGYRSADHFYSLGAGFFKEKAYEKAAGAFRNALEIDPRHADAERSLAITLEDMGRAPEAVQHLRRYLELRPNAEDAAEVAARIEAAGTP